jgi:hypothetical protein
MKIKVGEYIRTKNGVIAKLEYIHNKDKVCWFDKVIYSRYGEEIDFLTTEELPKYVISHSKNIIDLIEVNDIVTYWVDTQSYNGWVQNFVDKELLKDMKKNFIEEDIKSIVTHEQIEDMEYKL